MALGETEPLLQLYAMPQGVRGELWSSDCQRVPPAPLLRVVCYLEPLADDGPDAPPVELARTEVRHTADPLFTEPLELWDEASGRGGSRTLRFEVQDGAVMHGVDARPPVALAIATAASDALRRAGRSGSVMQGVALALPLRTPAGKALPGGRLHLYVHAGDGVRDLAQAQAQAQALAQAQARAQALALTLALTLTLALAGCATRRALGCMRGGCGRRTRLRRRGWHPPLRRSRRRGTP